MRGWLAAICLAAAVIAAACGPPSAGSGACKALLPGDLVITEVFADYHAADGSSADAGKEWFEIYNPTSHAIALAGLTLTHSRPDGTQADSHTMRAAMIAPGQYFTLGNAMADSTPPYVDYGYAADLGEMFNTGGGKLTLACSGQEIDSAGYTDVKEGHARELSAAAPPDYTANDDPAAWCQADGAEFEAGNFGTPGAASDCQSIVSGQCNDGGTLRDAVTPSVGDLVITEIMASPKAVADATGEWFEALAVHDVDLNGVGLDRAHDSLPPDVIASSDCLHVGAGSYVVFARSADPAQNGGLPPVAATFKLSLVAGTQGAPGDVSIVAGETVIDAVSWTAAPDGASLQLDPRRDDPTANDDPGNFCAATQAYGRGDLGTPGAANATCALLPPAGMCNDDGALRAIRPPVVGQLVISEYLANPANVAGATDATREWFEVANVGAAAFDLNQLVVGRIGAPGSALADADCIAVAAGGFAVLARSSDATRNGMLPAVAATFSFGLVDTGGDIQIAGPDGVLDAVHWASVTSGVSRQLDPAHMNPQDNDDPASFCAGSTAYGDQTNLGTPGAANHCP